MNQDNQNFLDLEKADLEQLCKENGFPKFRAKQLYEWQAKGISDFSEMTNLPKALRASLEDKFWIGLPEVHDHWASQSDGSEKFIFSYPDGELIESVFMRHNYGHSACLSTQVGCKMGCRFCASTGLKLRRHLSRGEIMGQIFALERATGEQISHIDLMGIGEPLDNYTEVVAFLKRMVSPDFRDFAVRKICLSTCGLVPEIKRLAKEGLGLTLSISLHAPNQALREKLMPIAIKFDLDELITAAKYYFESTGRRVSYEYAMFKGINDRMEDARDLVFLLRGQSCHVNLIPANPVPGSGFDSSDNDQINKFCDYLTSHSINATIRRSLGKDIRAACGQLRRSNLLEG